MREHVITTQRYEFDPAVALAAKLGPQSGLNLRDAGDGRAVAYLRSASDEYALALALCDVLLDEAARREIALAVEELALSPEEKSVVLPEAERLAQRAFGPKTRERVREKILIHIEFSDETNLEGFMRFRLRELLALFAAAAGKAADTLVLRGDYLELMAVLASFARMQPPRTKEVCLVLNADGSCTLTGAGGARINCENTGREGLISILLGLAPESIIVYDLSCGRGALLCEVVSRVFRERVRLFR